MDRYLQKLVDLIRFLHLGFLSVTRFVKLDKSRSVMGWSVLTLAAYVLCMKFELLLCSDAVIHCTYYCVRTILSLCVWGYAL